MASYLSHIQFDPRLYKTIHSKYLTNFRLVVLFIISVIVLGVFNYIEIPRRLNPEVKIPIVTVQTLLPGATPEDIEQLVTNPLEEKLKSVKDLEVMTSTSRDNFSVIILQFLSSVDPDEAQSDAQQIIDGVTSLPVDAESPTVSAVDFENQPIWIFALSSKDIPSLMSISKGLKNTLEDVSKIDKVELSGFENQEVQIIVDPSKAIQYGINPLALSQLISAATSSYPSGAVKTANSSFSLSLDPGITDIEDIRNFNISTANQVVSLSQIATIRQSSAANQTQSFIASINEKPVRAVKFFVYKTKNSNIDIAETAAHKVVDEYLLPYKSVVSISTVSNSAKDIQDQFSNLVGEFGTTIALIFVVLLVFLGLRQAVIASLTVPLTFLSAIAIANSMGMSLNFLTMFSFLIALGLLIDDTIVVVSAMTRYYSSGKFTPAETGLLVWRDFIIPLWSTTATTIWSFVPLLLATGIIGEFIKPIPIIVTATMLSSTSIAVLITIPLLIVVMKLSIPKRVMILLKILGVVIVFAAIYRVVPKSSFTFSILLLILTMFVVIFNSRKYYISHLKKQIKRIPNINALKKYSVQVVNSGVINIEKISYKYQKLLKTILNSTHNRRMTLLFLTVFALVSYLLVPLGFVTNEFFPKTDEDDIYLTIELPTGTNLQTTTTEMLTVLSKVKTLKNISKITAESGYQINSESDRQKNESSFLLTLDLSADRDKTSIEIASDLRKIFVDYNFGKVIVSEVTGGPPAGADIQIKLLGDDYKDLNNFADEIIAYLNKVPGTANVDKSIDSGTSKIIFVPDEAKLTEAGISRSTLGLWLRTYVTGFTLDSITLDEKTDIVFKMKDEQITPEELGNLVISSKGVDYPLLTLGSLKLVSNPTSITHEDTLRTLSVSASVTDGYVVSEINGGLEKFANTLDLPSGYSWKTGGVNEENQKSVNSIIQAMGLSFLLILITMVIVFGSYRQAAIVMLTIPLAISGVFYIFGLTGTPLSFPALIGILALFGIVVTNAIVVVAKINSNIGEGMELKDSILDASGSRLEPVLLTSLTTIFGLLPITLSDPLWRGLGGAIISGLFFSGLISLFFIPVLYYNWFKTDNLSSPSSPRKTRLR